jgi:hypothetical protein
VLSGKEKSWRRLVSMMFRTSPTGVSHDRTPSDRNGYVEDLKAIAYGLYHQDAAWSAQLLCSDAEQLELDLDAA